MSEIQSQMYDWQDKVMRATKEGNTWQLIASIYGDLQCRILLLENRIKELEEKETK